jgi:hypothetical protein
MRNLYGHLGLRSNASEADIRAAIGRCTDNELRADAQAVLLNPQVRRVYDQAHTAVSNVGFIRHNLSLRTTPNWNSQADANFRFNQAAQPRLSLLRSRLGSRQTAKHAQTPTNPAVVLLTVVGGLVLFGVLLSQCDSTTKPKQAFKHEVPIPTPTPTPATPTPTPVPTPTPFAEPVVPFPQSGTIRIAGNAEGVAPFEILSPKGENYYIKMVDAITGENKVVIFVRGGQPTEVMVPVGTYEIRYASGTTWYGESYLFGPDTAYTKTDEDFDFRRTPNGYSGYTVTLYKVERGNLSTSPLQPEDF